MAGHQVDGFGSPGTLRWIRALGSRSATSEGSTKLPNRTDMLNVRGRSRSRAIHVTRRPISSQVPSMNRPSAESRPCTSRQIRVHVSFLVLAQDVEGTDQDRVSGHRQFESAHNEFSARAVPAPWLRAPARARSRCRRPARPVGRRAAARKARRRWQALRRSPGQPPAGPPTCRRRQAWGPVSQRSTRRIRLGLVVPRVTFPTGLPGRILPEICGAATRSAFCTTAQIPIGCNAGRAGARLS